MSTVVEIQQAIAGLTEAEREELRLWLDACEEDDWDRQITADAASGKLDFMTRQAEEIPTFHKADFAALLRAAR